MIAIKGIWAKGHMIDADQILDVFKVFHKRFNGVVAVLLGDGGMGCCFDTDHTAFVSASLENIIGG